ncbi:MAG: hypothetical protein EPN92_01065 [Chitinophagaceae bacterium]|nr:MAG: hypothetical protein EPN92_01065 [Chitinophagaceae bacterium]
MKSFIYKLIVAFIVVGGLFIGMVKGQEARTKWMNKMKSRKENKRLKTAPQPNEVVLDDFEMASFHRN